MPVKTLLLTLTTLNDDDDELSSFTAQNSWILDVLEKKSKDSSTLINDIDMTENVNNISDEIKRKVMRMLQTRPCVDFSTDVNFNNRLLFMLFLLVFLTTFLLNFYKKKSYIF